MPHVTFVLVICVMINHLMTTIFQLMSARLSCVQVALSDTACTGMYHNNSMYITGIMAPGILFICSFADASVLLSNCGTVVCGYEKVQAGKGS